MAQVNEEGMKVGEGLYIRVVQGSALKEQDINAQQMEPTKFERLVENIRQRGALESIPYCSRPNDEGPISIVSGHHRAKAARMAGLTSFPVLIDTDPMPRSLIRAKQIAHNELSGSPDEEILRKMIEQIDDVEDMLVSGLGEEYLTPLAQSTTTLDLPKADFDWRMTTLMFLPEQMERFNDLLALIDKHSDMIGVARVDQFDEFSRALVEYGHVRNIKNMAAVVDSLTSIALREIAAAAEGKADDVE